MSNISGELTDQSKASGDTIDSMTDSVDGGIQSITSDLDRILNTSSRITDIISDDVNVLLGNGSAIDDVSGKHLQSGRSVSFRAAAITEKLRATSMQAVSPEL